MQQEETAVVGQLIHAVGQVMCDHAQRVACHNASCLLLRACSDAMVAPNNMRALDQLTRQDVRKSACELADYYGEKIHHHGSSPERMTSLRVLETIQRQPTVMVSALRQCQRERRVALANLLSLLEAA